MSYTKQRSVFINIITASELQEKIDHNPDLLLINVLNEENYTDCHIPGSVNITHDHLVENLAGLDKDKEVVLYCAHSNCSKSRQAYELLADLGFTNLYDYAGGMKDWRKKGFKTTGMCLMQYLHE